jgi:membrane-associated phospholipid phosphatase
VYDINYLVWLQSLRAASGSIMDGFFLFMSTLSFGIIASVIYTSLYWCVSKEAGTFMMFSCLTSGMVDQFLKNTFCVYRPWIRSAAVHPVSAAIPGATGYSFPSGHSASAASQYGGLAIWYKDRKILAVLLLTLMLLIAFSRNYLGVHTPQDVAAGLITGLASAWFMYRYFRRMSPFSGAINDVAMASVLAVAGLLLIIYINVKSFPMDYAAGKLIVDPAKMKIDVYSSVGGFWGLLAGWLAERKFVRFEMARNIWHGIARFAVGFAFFIVLEKYGACLIPFEKGTAPWLMTYYASLNFYIMAVYPFLFTEAEKYFRK